MPTTVKTYSALETMNSYSGTRLSINNLSTRQRSYFDPINCWTKRWRPAVENRVKA